LIKEASYRRFNILFPLEFNKTNLLVLANFSANSDGSIDKFL